RQRLNMSGTNIKRERKRMNLVDYYLLLVATQRATRDRQTKTTVPTSSSTNSNDDPSNPNAAPKSRKGSAGSLWWSLGPKVIETPPRQATPKLLTDLCVVAR